MLELNVHICVDIYVCCEQLQMRSACKLLAQAARGMIDTDFVTEGFKNLSLDALLKILRHQSSEVNMNQVDLMTDDAAVKAWMMHDPKTRQKRLSSMREGATVETRQMMVGRRNSGNAMVNSKEKLSLPPE
ncbi:Hypothetical protein PHPALM_13849 [Phytophthora palmivora]|uniref:Uncharacterized protein n=1 Tax=Phytophthora palmivora TaxID=4796 RepID=A0A2P4XWA4_9STRA|nr:Hypothetical protein PHPALM_13849 [Phytophthora palmivora]